MCLRFLFSSSVGSSIATKKNSLNSKFIISSSSTSIFWSTLRFGGSSASEQFVGSSQNESSASSSSPIGASKSSPNKTRPIPNADFVTTCPFQCLGLTRTATKEQIRENFLQLAKVHHPDVGGESWKFKRVNAAYKQSIEMVETGYAAKTANKQSKGQSYQAPNERECNGEKTEGCASDEEQFKSNSDRSSSNNTSSTNENNKSNKKTSTSTKSDNNNNNNNNNAGKNKYANPERTANFSSAHTYANAERQAGSWNRSTGDNTSQQHTYSSKSEYYNSFMHGSSGKNKSKHPSGKGDNGDDDEGSFRSSQFRDENAKAHNKSADWFKEMYESSNAKWKPTSTNNNNNSKSANQSKSFHYNSFDGKKAYEGTSKNGDSKNQQKSADQAAEENTTTNDEKHAADDEHCRYEQYRKTSFTSDESAEREFGSEEGWFEFRENFFRQNRSITTRDLYRFRFSQATSMEEIDAIYKQSMDENIFSGYDIGEPLFLALERYHLGLGLGDKHLRKCFATIDDWEVRTNRTAVALYYHVILKLYTNDKIMSLFPDLDSSIATEVVWRVLQRMQDRGVVDDECVGRSWWELLRLACMHRDPHHW